MLIGEMKTLLRSIQLAMCQIHVAHEAISIP